jgi:hypothetical protein
MIAALWHALHPLVDVLGVWFLVSILAAIAWVLWLTLFRAEPQ